MKKIITVEQLKELTLEQKQKLRDWWKPNFGDMFSWCDIGPCGPVVTHKNYPDENSFFGGCGIGNPREYLKSECLPLPDISQMIELLESKDHFFSISKEIACDDLGCLNWGWLIEINTKESPHQIEYMEFSTDELADCLWKVVKTIL
jgi:hypothetical protein